MDNRKWEADAIASPPTAPGSPSDGYPTNGNPLAAQNATEPGEWWFHAVGEELRAVIVEGGLTPNISTLTQLRDAIKNIAKGGDYKDSVRVASTAAINLAAPGANIDGVAMVAGDRFLEKDNATLANRGIYIWNGAAVPATRALDADTGAELNGGAIIPVEAGTVNADTQWILTNDGIVTIGTTGLTFAPAGVNKGLFAKNVYSHLVSTTLTAANLGGTVLLYSVTPFTETLPAISDCPSGTRIEFFNFNTGAVTIERAGANQIFVADSTLTQLVLNAGDSLTLESRGDYWFAVSGTAQIPYAAGFKSDLATGWKRYPDKNSPTGYITRQWGVSGTITAGSSANITFPLAFTTAILNVSLTALGVSVNANPGGAPAAQKSLTGLTIYNWGSVISYSQGVQWIVEGY